MISNETRPRVKVCPRNLVHWYVCKYTMKIGQDFLDTEYVLQAVRYGETNAQFPLLDAAEATMRIFQKLP